MSEKISQRFELLKSICEERDNSVKKILDEVREKEIDLRKNEEEMNELTQMIDYQKKIAALFGEYKTFLIGTKNGLRTERAQELDTLINDYKSKIESNLSLSEYQKTKNADSKSNIAGLEDKINTLLLQNYTDEDGKEEYAQNTSMNCIICMEAYNSSEHRHACINLCGHQFGRSCLIVLENKRCPVGTR